MSWRPTAIAVAAYTALAVALTFPLVLHLASVVPHDVGDPLLSAAILWWNAHVLPFTERWWNGFAYFPASGFMALSDHRLGESLIATPLQWLGCSPLTAYNVTLLAMFPLCAIAAHWLGFVLTERHDAAALCGLAYGFCPYRVAHLQHLELLAAFGMPAALAALHRYAGTRERRWLVVLSAALVVQGLSASYYLLFFAVLLGMWTFWFIGWRDTRGLLALVVACGCAAAVLMPVIVGYARIHARYGFERSLNDIIELSADVTSLGTSSPMVALWGWTARWSTSEGELFPGITIASLAILGATLAWRRTKVGRDSLDVMGAWLIVAAGGFAAIALCGWWLAPWRIDLGVLRLSSAAPFKPFSIAALAIVLALATSSRFRNAYAQRSTFAFYVIATAVLLVCSFGPMPRLLGHQFLYEPPYKWLMRLPVFGSVRVPARFAMPAMLTLSVSGALAFSRFRLEPGRRRAWAIALMVGIVADGWVVHLPLPAAPAFWPAARAQGFAAVLELPLGGVFDDLAATFRVINHGHPTVNGASGFEPPHYMTLRTALQEHDPSALDGFPSTEPILIVVDSRTDPNGEWKSFLRANPRVTPLGGDRSWLFFSLKPAAVEPPCRGDAVPIVGARDDRGPVNVDELADGNIHTSWSTGAPQRVGDALVLELASAAQPCAVLLSVGTFGKNYPRKLSVDMSADGITWKAVVTERTAGLTIRAALEDPKRVTMAIPLAASVGRFVRLRLDDSHATLPWVVTDVSVRTAATR